MTACVNGCTATMRGGLLVLGLLAGGLVVAADKPLFIGEVQVEDVRASETDTSVLHYEIVHEAPDLLQQRLSGWFPLASRDVTGVTVSMQGYPVALKPNADDRHSASTFLVDYAEPAVQILAGEIRERFGEQPSPPELEQFVHDYIADKNTAHGFDIASQVARSRAGDCTEHAVLLTSLLRMYGYPARTVTGLFVSLENPVMAYGHAWAEFYSDHGWSGLDGTRISESVGAQHIPLGVVEDESIAYAIGLIGTLQALAIERVIIK